MHDGARFTLLHANTPHKVNYVENVCEAWHGANINQTVRSPLEIDSEPLLNAVPHGNSIISVEFLRRCIAEQRNERSNLVHSGTEPVSENPIDPGLLTRIIRECL